MGIPWNSMGDSWMGGWHGGLPWQGHVENTMGIPWNSMGGWTPGWVGGMEAFHGKTMWRTPWASHGIPWGRGVDSWMGGWHGGLPWQDHVENTMGIPWNSLGGSWMGGWHGGLPWQCHVENTMGIPWNSMGGWTP